MAWQRCSRFPNRASYKLVGVQVGPEYAMPAQNRGLALSQFAIYFEGRLDNALDI